ncbi:hypothetical protein [Clostridium estertheticum]|uniref:Uncharacterized protein n=1 Tax=Clostridium estertheticum TaxID=238834 RepID=A0AA47ELL8_9CLOT|nr:hypothetical protein [Clostridium estertheticum]MBU3157360.1 hypothetical protein [Clostridium estertheticum]WAG62461.1 hypothetical protein LL038_09585 [Clostridium estertheticum]
MYKNRIYNKKHYLIIAIIIATCLGYKYVSYRPNKYININDLVNKAYTSSKYDSEMAKHMSKDVYKDTNGYIMCELYQCKKPIKISFKSTEINQHKINGKIFVYMVYDFKMFDADGKLVTGALNSSVVFTVTGTNDNLYIEDNHEYMSGSEVPKMYRYY